MLRALAMTALLLVPAESYRALLSAQQADPADVASIDAIVAAVYDVISGPAGQTRDWDRWRSLFAPGATLGAMVVGPDGSARRVAMSPDDYAVRSGPVLERDGFFEEEIGRTTETFGLIAHAFSTYASRRTPSDPEPFMRGINSFQLMHDGSRWFVVSIFWQSEDARHPIPARYIRGMGGEPTATPVEDGP